MNDEVGSTALRKTLQRLVPFSMLLFFVQMTDKTNVSYAALQMNQDLGFTPTVYGVGAGIFFLGAFLFEIPSNLILLRVGARRWLARIMISWGLIVAGLAWVHSAKGFYMLRFFLGAAEAGLLPGLMYYLGTWIPKERRGVATSWLMSASAIGPIIGAPLATGIMELHGLGGFAGWQWLFLLEGGATVVVGFLTLCGLPNTPADAKWLNSREQQWLTEVMGRELAAKQRTGMTSLAAGFLNRRVLIALVISFLLVFCNFGFVLWLPQMLKSFGGLSNMQVGLLSVLPYTCGAIGMILCGRFSDRFGERRWYLVGGGMAAALGYAAAGFAPNNILAFLGMCIAAAGILSTFGVFWAYANDLLGGAAAAGGLAFINTASQLGGFLGPTSVGYLRQATHSFTEPLVVLAACSFLTAMVALALKKPPPHTSALSSRALA
jgi:ACS family tartrate transporter-like MFS transporter